jgi:hypothetical protein
MSASMQVGAGRGRPRGTVGAGLADEGGPAEIVVDLGFLEILRASETTHVTGAVPRIDPAVATDSWESLPEDGRNAGAGLT